MRDDGTGLPGELGEHCFTWTAWQTGTGHGAGTNELPAEQIGFRNVSASVRREERLQRRGVAIVRTIRNVKR